MAGTAPIKLGSGASAALTPLPGVALTKGTRGKLDTLVRPYLCPTANVTSLIPSLYSADATYTSMYLAEYRSESMEGTTSRLELIYRGLASGAVDTTYSEPGICLQSVTTTTTASGATVNLTVDYYAPSTAYYWIATSDPSSTIANSTVLGSLSPISYIIGWSAQSSDGSDGYVSYSDFVTALNTLSTVHAVAHYRASMIVPGQYWECESQAIKQLRGT